MPPTSSAPPTVSAIESRRRARLAGAVFEKTGVAIDPVDPGFALVELNRLALQEAVDELVRQVAERADSLPGKISVLTAVAGKRMVELALRRIADELGIARKELQDDVSRAGETLRQYADASRAAQSELGAQLARSIKTAILLSGALVALVVVLLVVVGTMVFVAWK